VDLHPVTVVVGGVLAALVLGEVGNERPIAPARQASLLRRTKPSPWSWPETDDAVVTIGGGQRIAVHDNIRERSAPPSFWRSTEVFGHASTSPHPTRFSMAKDFRKMKNRSRQELRSRVYLAVTALVSMKRDGAERSRSLAKVCAV